jgi:hypothetical protein
LSEPEPMSDSDWTMVNRLSCKARLNASLKKHPSGLNGGCWARSQRVADEVGCLVVGQKQDDRVDSVEERSAVDLCV